MNEKDLAHRISCVFKHQRKIRIENCILFSAMSALPQENFSEFTDEREIVDVTESSGSDDEDHEGDKDTRETDAQNLIDGQSSAAVGSPHKLEQKPQVKTRPAKKPLQKPKNEIYNNFLRIADLEREVQVFANELSTAAPPKKRQLLKKMPAWYGSASSRPNNTIHSRRVRRAESSSLLLLQAQMFSFGLNHPDTLCESVSLASTSLPPLMDCDELRLPKDVLTSGKLSAPQLEAVCYAVKRFRTKISVAKADNPAVIESVCSGKHREKACIKC
jgi:hypothetical protein